MDNLKIRTMIVEDELLARAGLRSLIDWEKMGFILLEDAKDGEEALERVRQYQPDLLLLDINIPIISGLELLKIIKEEHIPTKAVIISCYDDFDTVKMAMKLGAVDYVRKFGLTKEELTNTLANIVGTPGIRFLKGETKSAAQTRRDMKKSIQEAPEGFKKGYCLCFCMLWKHTDEMVDLKIIETICGQFYHGMGKEIVTKIYEGKMLLFSKAEVRVGELEALRKQIRHFIDAEFYVSITAYDTADIPEMYFLKLLNSIEVIAFYGGGEGIVPLEKPVEVVTSYPFDVNQYYKEIDRALATTSQKDMFLILDRLFEEIAGCAFLSVNLVKKLMIELLSRFSDRASHLGGTMEEVIVFGSYKHYQSIVHITNFKDMKEWIYQFVQEYVNAFFSRQKRSESELIEQVLNYIDTNLTSVLQLGEAARRIGVSEPYLSSYFKKNMGENFIPYVNRRKVEEAKKMLKEGKLVYQVSDILGFENSTYFSKLFKKIEGVTPEQYRKGN